MSRSVPIGPFDKARAKHATSAIRINPNDSNGLISKPMKLSTHATRPKRPPSGGTSAILAARKIVGRKRKRGVTPCDGRARQQKRRGEMQTYSVEIMQHRDERSALSLPALQEMQEILGRALIEGGERLVQQNDIGVLHEQPRKQSSLELTDGKFGDLPIHDGSRGRRPRVPRRHSRQGAPGGSRTEPKFRQSPSATSSATEIGNPRSSSSCCGRYARRWRARAAQMTSPAVGRMIPASAFRERALPGPVWADHSREARGRKLASHALKRVSFAIAHGKIADRDSSLSARTVSVGRAGIIAAIEMTGEGSLRVIP